MTFPTAQSSYLLKQEKLEESLHLRGGGGGGEGAYNWMYFSVLQLDGRELFKSEVQSETALEILK